MMDAETFLEEFLQWWQDGKNTGTLSRTAYGMARSAFLAGWEARKRLDYTMMYPAYGMKEAEARQYRAKTAPFEAPEPDYTPWGTVPGPEGGEDGT